MIDNGLYTSSGFDKIIDDVDNDDPLSEDIDVVSITKDSV